MKNIFSEPPFSDILVFIDERMTLRPVTQMLFDCMIDLNDPQVQDAFAKSAEKYHLDQRQIDIRKAQIEKIFDSGKRIYKRDKYSIGHGYDDFTGNSQMLRTSEEMESDDQALKEYLLHSLSVSQATELYKRYSNGKEPTKPLQTVTGYDRFVITAADLDMTAMLIENDIIQLNYPKDYDQKTFIDDLQILEANLFNIANAVHKFGDNFAKKLDIDRRVLQLQNVLS